MRVGCLLAEGSLGWLWTRSPACSAHERPPLMHGRAILERALSARSAVVFRPFNSWIRSPVLGAGVEPATDDLSGRCSTRLSHPVEVMPGVEPRPFRANQCITWHPSIPAARHGRHRQAFARAPPTGGVHEPQTCERLPSTTDSLAPEPFSSGAMPSAAVRPATRERRRGCAGLRAGSPRSGSARTVGTPAACPLPPACGRPCGRCTRRKP